MQISNISFGRFPLGYEGQHLDKSKNGKRKQNAHRQGVSTVECSDIKHSSEKFLSHDRDSMSGANSLLEAPSFYNAFVYTPKPEIKTYTGQNFLKSGGRLYFDRAILNGNKYNNAITATNDVLHISNSYDNGVKDSIFVFLHDGCDDTTIFTNIEKVEENNLNNGGKTIYYEDSGKNCKYVEDYNGDGKLEYVTLERYDDGKESPQNKGNFISRTIAKFDKTGTRIVETEVKIGDKYKGKAGFSTQTTTFDENNKKVKEEKTDVVDGNTTIARSVSKFNKNEIASLIDDYECMFYSDNSLQSPYAKCDRRITSKKDGKISTLYDNYKTLDYTNGINFLRGCIYIEHPHTIKFEQGNQETYIDGDDQKPYAIETYSDNGALVSVENLDDNSITNISYMASNAIFLKTTDSSGRKISNMLIGIKDEKLSVALVEEFDPETGKKIARYKPYDVE